MLKTIQSGIGTIHDNRRLSNDGFAGVIRLFNEGGWDRERGRRAERGSMWVSFCNGDSFGVYVCVVWMEDKGKKVGHTQLWGAGVR